MWFLRRTRCGGELCRISAVAKYCTVDVWGCTECQIIVRVDFSRAVNIGVRRSVASKQVQNRT